MQHPIEEQWSAALRSLEESEKILQSAAADDLRVYSGLRDIDDLLLLVKTKLQIAILLMDHMPDERSEQREEIFRAAQARAQRAVQILDDLTHAGVSVDQEDVVKEDPVYQEARELFQELILKGGAAFFDDQEKDKRKVKILAKAVADALEKFIDPDDNYRRVFKMDELSPALRKMVKLLFPILAPEHQKDPPYGIPEGEEKIYRSQAIKLPVSQAIHYIEGELLPALYQDLSERPGDPAIQRQISSLEERASVYRRLKFFPRSTPVLLEKDFYTGGLSHYSADGELLVKVSLPVAYRSGTNLTRIQELVKTELTRRIAGKGICPEIDEEYEWLKQIKSGIRGSSRTPSFKIDTTAGFRTLKTRFPIMKSLENRRLFQELLDYYRSHGKRSTQRLLTDSIMTQSIHPEKLLE
jgi:hypothetical protein